MIIRVQLSRAENTEYFRCNLGEIVNVDIEEYVSAVVASEIGNAPLEACKAQAIAARTFAMKYVGDDKYITDKSSTHQAFRASRWDAKKYPNANDAAKQTAGMVLTYDGIIIKICSYSSSNGGRTVSSEERWGSARPYLVSKEDPWDEAACAERYASGKPIAMGHGVGMSQYGAAWAAKNGIGYREILGFYYAGTKIVLDYGKAGNTMTYDPKMVIDIALAEVGYLEKASNAELDEKYANPGNKNFTKYARDLAKIPFFNSSKMGVAWCSVFVSWCFNAAYGEDAARKLLCQPPAKNNCGAGCGSAMKYFKAKGQLHDTPEIGDQVFFWSSDKSTVSHTGLVYHVDSNYVYTVEGNTSSASGVVANGGAVARKKYKLGYERFAGFGRPNYGMEASASVTEAPVTDAKSVTIVSKNGKVNLRKGNGVNYGRVTSVASGTTYPYVATSDNGWHGIVYGKQVLWVSGEYSKVTG